MKKVAAVLIFSLFMVFAFSIAQAEEKVKTMEVTVKSGDTLWGYAKKYLNDSELWPKIAAYNPQIKDSHLLIPGQKVIIPLDVAGEIKKEMVKEVVSKKDELGYLRSRVRELEAEVKELKSMRDILDENAKLKIENELSKAKTEELNKKIEDLETEIVSLKAKIKVLEEEIEELKATIVRLEKELEEKKMAFWFLFLLVGLGTMAGM